MAKKLTKKEMLRLQRSGTIINLKSAKQEGLLGKALVTVAKKITDDFGVLLHHTRQWKLPDIVARLKTHFPDVSFD